MVRLSIILFLFFTSCGVKSIKLKDGITRVPRDQFFFNENYRKKYSFNKLSEIDFNSIYVESYYVSQKGKLYDSQKGDHSFINVVKFYDNRCVNFFSIEKNDINNLPVLNPEERGNRGVLYNKNNETLADIVVPADDSYRLGKKTYVINVKGDTLFLFDKKSKSKYIYIRKQLSEKNLKYKANW